MSVYVRVPRPDQEPAEMPLRQLLRLAALVEENPDSMWHFNDCGCCVCLHPGGDLTRGWVIGPDGGADYHEVAHG